MKIEVLGTGCSKCNQLYELVKETAAELEIDHEIEKVSDITKIVNYGILSTPGLVINGKVKLSGKLPSKNEITKILSE